MRLIDELEPGDARAVRGVFMDIDGTLTDDGRLGAAAYGALWRLARAGLWVVPVTGRPAGWCDLIARQWPVDGVVGENGALAFWEIDGVMKRTYHPDTGGEGTRRALEKVEEAILTEVPGSRVATDQPFRMFDLAIDFCEEPPDLGLAAAERIREIFIRHGAHAKISNIHVNGWFGDYDKLAMVRRFAVERWQIDIDGEPDRYLFCGDSPNDEPMFAFFPNACAVANIAPFVESLTHLPRFVTAAPGGAGFAELVEVLLARRG